MCPAMHPKQTVNHTVTKSHVELQTCRAAEARRARNHGQAPCRPVPQLLHASAHSPPCPGGVGHPSGVTPPLASPASMQGLPPHGARRSTLASSDGSAEAPKRPRGRLRGLRDGARRRAAAGRNTLSGSASRMRSARSRSEPLHVSCRGWTCRTRSARGPRTPTLALAPAKSEAAAPQQWWRRFGCWTSVGLCFGRGPAAVSGMVPRHCPGG